MKFISHRGNTIGPEPEKENKIETIIQCIEKHNLDVEIDIFVKDGIMFLTHDDNESGMVNEKHLEILKTYKDRLWIHCKNLEALIYMQTQLPDFNYFGHSNDDFVLTSKKYIFTRPGIAGGERVICVMPEMASKTDTFENYFAVLTDYPLHNG